MEREPLFDLYDKSSKESNDAHHLAAMTAILGPPPPEFLARSDESKKYWDSKGNENRNISHSTNNLQTGMWKGPVPLPPPRKIADRITSLTGVDKDNFVDLLSYLLCWRPEDRFAAGQVYFHPWLRGLPLEECLKLAKQNQEELARGKS